MSRKRLRYADLDYIEANDEELGEFEIRIKDVLVGPSPWPALFAKLDMEEGLKVLSPKLREVWQLVMLEGYTVSEVARKMKKHHELVRRDLLRAGDTLRLFFQR